MIFEENISLASFTTFHIGGNARYFCVVKSEEDIFSAVSFAKTHSVPFFILGGGSNILVDDNGYLGLVIFMSLNGIKEDVSDDVVRISVGAGESWDRLVNFCVEMGYWGMENLSLIPGTVGAAPVQNIGAYGCEAKDIIESVRVIDSTTGAARVLSNAECLFGYRDSIFKKPKGKNLIITNVVFKLSKKAQPNLIYKDLKEYFLEKNGDSESAMLFPNIADIRKAVISIRLSKFPNLSQFGTAGSFWKNPIVSIKTFEAIKISYPLIPSHPASNDSVKIPLAWILDNICGLKGYVKGKVHLFKNQPLVLTVEKGATSDDINHFASEIESIVALKTGLIIEREVNSVLC